jgi:uncharacterized protein (DUF1778 family)
MGLLWKTCQVYVNKRTIILASHYEGANMLLAMPKASGPQMNIRFGSRKQIEQVRKAAMIMGQSLNTFAFRQLLKAADAVIAQEQAATARPDAVAV